MNQNAVQRYYSFDALRSLMMLLGIIIHAIVPYTTYTKGAFAGLFKDAQTSRVCDVLLFWIHLYRMPIFFAMAGFFAALIYYKKGKKPFWKNRLNRIVYPLIVGWIILNPINRFTGSFAKSMTDSNICTALQSGLENLKPFPWGESPQHLWFLYFLILFYALMQLSFLLPANFKSFINNWFRKMMNSPLNFIWFSIYTIGFLLLMDSGTFDTPKRFIPLNLKVFFSYFYFFSFGILLYINKDLISYFKKNAWYQLAFSFLAFIIHFYFVDKIQSLDAPSFQYVFLVSLSGGICSWLTLFSFIGLFLIYFEKENKYVSYFSNASYWVYLIHVPLLLILSGLFYKFEMCALVKCLLSILITFMLTILSYELLVRKTFIGKFLNGEKRN